MQILCHHSKVLQQKQQQYFMHQLFCCKAASRDLLPVHPVSAAAHFTPVELCF